MSNKRNNDYLVGTTFEDIDEIIENGSFKPVDFNKINTFTHNASHKRVSSTTGMIEPYLQLQKYGDLSIVPFPPVFARVKWYGRELYDLRRWKADGSPGKGMTFTAEELTLLLNKLKGFNYGQPFRTVIRKYSAGSSQAKFYYHIATLSSSIHKGINYNKEVNIIDWGFGKGPQVDIHKWSSDYSRCRKGLCLSLEELKEFETLIENNI